MFLYDVADWVFGPLKDLLAAVVGWLSNLSLVAARGIDPALYLGAFAWLGPTWLSLIKQIILGVVLFGLILVARVGYSLYLDIKAGVKWW